MIAMDQSHKSKIHPKERANFLSLLTFFYTRKFFWRGYKKDLEVEDLYQVLSTCKSKALGDLLENQVQRDKKEHGKLSVIRVLWRCFGKTYLLFGLMQLIMRTVFVLTIPEALGKLVSYFIPKQTVLTFEDACYYAATVVIFTIVNFMYTHNYMLAINEYGIRIRTAICSLIYRKALMMTEGALAEITMGKIITLITKDVHSVEMFILFANDIWIGLIQTVIMCYLIYSKIGTAAFAGVGFFLTVLPLQLFIGKLATSYRLKTSKKTDERLQLSQEILSAIKIIKMYGWEEFFTNKVARYRKKEVRSIWKLFYTKVVIIVIGGLSSKLAFYLLIMTYVWLGNNITAEIVYFIMSCFGKLRHVLSIVLPLGISYLAEFYATLIRLSSVLDAEELMISTQENLKTDVPKITIKSLNFESLFDDISVSMEKGLNIIVGHVGCGKTTFLKTILGTYKYDGSIFIQGRISYASQEPWLFPSTIRNNIIFGEQFNLERYDQVLEVCALKQDLRRLKNGDNTNVGDNGTNLSKGQQARVNLARAVYKNADCYLFDDCLAALDCHVSDFIFQKCIKEFLADKLCLLATNNPEHIQEALQVLEIKNAKISKVDIQKCTRKEKRLQISEFKEIALEKEQIEEEDVYREIKKAGKVDFANYRKYFQFGGGYFIFGLIMLLFLAVQSAVSYSEVLVSKWVTTEQNLSSFKMDNLTDGVEYEKLQTSRSYLLNLYTIIIVVSTGLSLFKFFAFFSFNMRASINVHKAMISTVIHAKMTFFDSHFIGNILNRFSKDLNTIDEHLPFVMNECFEILFVLGGVLVLVAAVNTIFLIPASIFLILAVLARHVYQRTGRSLQRLEASTRSPLIGHLNASLEGLTTIRAFRAQEMIKDQFDKHQDLYTSVSYCTQSASRALAFVLDGMCSIFIAIVILRFLLAPLDTTVGNVGLAISQSFHLTGLLQYGIRRWADFENQMTSVERVIEYTDVEQEKADGKIIQSWPKSGAIKYDNVSLDYNAEAKKVIKNVTFFADSGKKIGIVGRTGAGKSSIVSALFRLYDIEGKITIDDEDIEEMSIKYLRSNLTVIPQDPVLFTGTFRQNIDPFDKYTDDDLWKIIKATKLEKLVKNLTDQIDRHSSFSAGQKQLICLARAVARKNKIIVLDEATSNLDYESDALIRDVIEQELSSCTFIIIAHRLSSVMSTDLVIVLEDGEIVEQNRPEELLKDKTSLFSQIFQQF